MNYTDEQIEQHFDALPDEVQDKVFSLEVEGKVERISFGAGLQTTQIKKLNALVNYVILELLDERGFLAECQSVFQLSADDAKELWQIIDREVFAPIEAIKVRAIEEAREEAGDDSSLEPGQVAAEEPVVPMSPPENLPVAEEVEPLIPPIPEKKPRPQEEAPVHPFEEKMKQPATVGVTVQTPPQTIPHTIDPYREPIE